MIESAKPEASTLSGHVIAITGRLASMGRHDAIALIERHGGRYEKQVTDSTTMIVLGQEGWPLSKDGKLTRSLRTAYDLRNRGQDLAIVHEVQFLQQIHSDERLPDVSRLHTTEQLSRILEIAPSEIRSWVKRGLIVPAKTVRRLCYFDFAQVVRAKQLHDLLSSGVSSAEIRKSLEQIQRFLPGTTSQRGMNLIEEGGQLLVRLDDGRLAEPSGQLQLDFGEESSVEAPTLGRESTEDPEKTESPKEPSLRIQRDWFEEALRSEEGGDLEAAAEAYHHAMVEGDIEPEMCFNLGNVLFELGRKDAASQRYMQAAELDPTYVEAWNNLGNVLAELGRLEQAVRSYDRALQLEPHYADAHYNLGESYFQMGLLDKAREHWHRYLEQDPHSSWARHVQNRLGEIEELEKR